MISTGKLDYRNVDDESWAINSDIGRGLDESFQSEVGRAPKVGDIVQYYAPGNDVGYAIRTSDKWVNLGYDKYPGGYVHGNSDGVPNWHSINPLLSIKDRLKIAINPAFGFFPYSQKAGVFPFDAKGLRRFDDNKQFGEILVHLDAIEERHEAILNEEEVNEDDYINNYQLVIKSPYDSNVDQIFSLGSDWGEICPFLTSDDRKLLDYLHDKFDSEIPN